MNSLFNSGSTGKIAIRFIIRAVLLFPMLWLVGCTTTAAFTPAGPPSNTFLLDTYFVATKSDIPLGKEVLIVTLPHVRPGYDSRRIAYTKTPLTISYYAESEWADTPALMLAPLIVSALESSSAFRAVLSETAPVAGDLRLDTDIIRLQQEFLEQPSSVRFTLRAKLYDVTQREIVAIRILEAIEPALSEDAYGGAQAANNAVRRVLDELSEFAVESITDGTGR